MDASNLKRSPRRPVRDDHRPLRSLLPRHLPPHPRRRPGALPINNAGAQPLFQRPGRETSPTPTSASSVTFLWVNVYGMVIDMPQKKCEVQPPPPQGRVQLGNTVHSNREKGSGDNLTPNRRCPAAQSRGRTSAPHWSPRAQSRTIFQSALFYHKVLLSFNSYSQVVVCPKLRFRGICPCRKNRRLCQPIFLVLTTELSRS